MDHRLKEHLIILVCLSVTVIPTFTRKYRTFGELICGSTFFLARSTSHTCTYIGGEGKLNNFKEYIIFKKRPILIKICSECSKISENRSQLNFWVVYRCGKKIFKMLRTLNRQTLWSRNENRISVTKISEKKRFQKVIDISLYNAHRSFRPRAGAASTAAGSVQRASSTTPEAAGAAVLTLL